MILGFLAEISFALLNESGHIRCLSLLTAERPRIDEHASQSKIHDTFADFVQSQQGPHGFADFLDGFLIIVLQAVKDAVDKFFTRLRTGLKKNTIARIKITGNTGDLVISSVPKARFETDTTRAYIPDCPSGKQVSVGAFDNRIDSK